MWNELLEETKSTEFKAILSFLKKEQKEGKVLAPHQNDIFRAFKIIPYLDVKVVILGQDPYPTPGHANGLAFATNGKQTPKSPEKSEKPLTLGMGRDSEGMSLKIL